MTSEGLFDQLFVSAALRAAVGDRAWLQAMLDAERALAAAEALAGVIPQEAADAIGACCDAERFDMAELGRGAPAAGNPVVPLVQALRGAVGGEGGRYVHWGATSQDVMDTAAMLVARRAGALVAAELDSVARASAHLARLHADTVMAGRTLLQQALPTTFGLKAAGWLTGALDARARLAEVLESRLAAQLGGAAGTLASLGDAGPRVLAAYAAELDLAEPELPWHTLRGRVAELGAALAIAAGALEKPALDIVLLAQTEVGEVAEHAGAGRGGSSTLPHKRNPIGAVLVRAGAQRARASAGVLLGAMAHEHERAAGAWHAEWEPLRDALALTGGAAETLTEVLQGLEIRPERMRANLDATGGLLMAERVTLAIAPRAGRQEAHAAVAEASRRAARSGAPLRDELLAEPVVSAHLDAGELDALLDPSGYLGSAPAFVRGALERAERELGL